MDDVWSNAGVVSSSFADDRTSHGRPEHVPGLSSLHAQTRVRVGHCLHLPPLPHQRRAGPGQAERRFVFVCECICDGRMLCTV